MTRRYFDNRGNRLFEVGDRVTRDGSDVHVIEAVWGKLGEGPETVDVRCITPPNAGWIAAGEVDPGMMAWDYRFVDPAIEALAPSPEPLPPEWQAKLDAAKTPGEAIDQAWQYQKWLMQQAMRPRLDQIIVGAVEVMHREGAISDEQYEAFKADPTVTWEWKDVGR